MVKQVHEDKISRLRKFQMFKQVHEDKISRLRKFQMFKQVHEDKRSTKGSKHDHKDERVFAFFLM